MSHPSLHSFAYLERFSCLGERCEDTCCKGWGMQLDAPHFALYQKEAPELLDAVTTGEAEHIMRRDPITDYCVKFESGLCSIHKTRGTSFLGDACHFYPRVTRQYHTAYTQTATLSCPEITRLVLFGDAPFARTTLQSDRLPFALKNYAPDALTDVQALSVLHAFIAACDDPAVSAERVLMRIVSAAHSLHFIAPSDWSNAASVFLKIGEMNLPPAEIDFRDGYHLVQILEALIGASKHTERPRLDDIRTSMLAALQIKITANNYEVLSTSGDFTSYQQVWERWQPKRAALDGVLKRWLQGQLAMGGFPFSGFGRDLPERALILAVRFATLRLALMCAPSLEQPDIVRIVQSLSRFLDHLADPELSVLAYKELGWDGLARLRGLVMDV